MKMRNTQMRNTQMMMIIIIIITVTLGKQEVEGMWCVARSDASDDELQRGLDYACAAGADCAPIQQKGLCYLPNTLQAHASYAYNSYYQRSNCAPTSCHFSNTATLAKTDPSYGSCVYPASPSTAGAGAGISSSSGGIGGTPATTNPNITPATTTTTNSPTAIDGGGGGGFSPTAMGPPISTTTDSNAPTPLSASAATALSLLLLFHITLSSLL